MADLFISHSHQDVLAARDLRALLEAAGYTCWMAPDDVTLHVAQRAIRAVGLVRRGTVGRAHAPHAEPGTGPAGGVWVAEVTYHRLARPILVGVLPEMLRPQPPFNRRGNLQQITCCTYSTDRASVLATLYRDRWPTGSPLADRELWPDTDVPPLR